MAFCVQCGNKVGDADRFCALCGAVQHGAAGPRTGSASDPISNISSRNASLICYIPYVGWIAAIVVLASERFRRDANVRFHAFQGLYLFVAWLIVDWVVSPILSIGAGFGVPFHHLGASILQLLIFIAWIVMLIKVSHEEHYRLPILGDLAERSVSEQRS
jgi:uncharacterized membrane protein